MINVIAKRTPRRIVLRQYLVQRVLTVITTLAVEDRRVPTG
ncbi:MAG: hypothetical protein VB824_09395 [Dehalococcoidia bacterium]